MVNKTRNGRNGVVATKNQHPSFGRLKGEVTTLNVGCAIRFFSDSLDAKLHETFVGTRDMALTPRGGGFVGR